MVASVVTSSSQLRTSTGEADRNTTDSNSITKKPWLLGLWEKNSPSLDLTHVYKSAASKSPNFFKNAASGKLAATTRVHVSGPVAQGNHFNPTDTSRSVEKSGINPSRSAPLNATELKVSRIVGVTSELITNGSKGTGIYKTIKPKVNDHFTSLTNRSLLSTLSLILTQISLTVPALGEATAANIFMASRVSRVSPSLTF